MTHLLIRTAAFAAACTLAAGAAWAIDPGTDTAAAATLLIALTAALTVLRPGRASHLIVGSAGSVALAAVHAARASGSGTPLEHVAAATVLALGVAATVFLGARLHDALLREVWPLTSGEHPDPGPGRLPLRAARPGSAHGHEQATRLIALEVERARRYHHAFAVLMLAPAGWASYLYRMDPAHRERTSAELEQHLLARLRSTDALIAVDDGRFVMLLPETPVEGAHVVATKLAIAGEALLGLEMRTGIAEYPDDATTAEALIREASEALAFAEQASIAVASRALLT